MARYFFHVYNGHQSHDDIGSEFADMAEIREEAVTSIGELVQKNLLTNKDMSSCVINVVDDMERTVMIVSLAAFVETVAQPTAHPILPSPLMISH
jgi:cell division GTPase FtsZ